jgi:hypothetical protein
MYEAKGGKSFKAVVTKDKQTITGEAELGDVFSKDRMSIRKESGKMGVYTKGSLNGINDLFRDCRTMSVPSTGMMFRPLKEDCTGRVEKCRSIPVKSGQNIKDVIASNCFNLPLSNLLSDDQKIVNYIIWLGEDSNKGLYDMSSNIIKKDGDYCYPLRNLVGGKLHAKCRKTAPISSPKDPATKTITASLNADKFLNTDVDVNMQTCTLPSTATAAVVGVTGMQTASGCKTTGTASRSKCNGINFKLVKGIRYYAQKTKRVVSSSAQLYGSDVKVNGWSFEDKCTYDSNSDYSDKSDWYKKMYICRVGLGRIVLIRADNGKIGHSGSVLTAGQDGYDFMDCGKSVSSIILMTMHKLSPNSPAPTGTTKRQSLAEQGSLKKGSCLCPTGTEVIGVACTSVRQTDCVGTGTRGKTCIGSGGCAVGTPVLRHVCADGSVLACLKR